MILAEITLAMFFQDFEYWVAGIVAIWLGFVFQFVPDMDKIVENIYSKSLISLLKSAARILLLAIVIVCLIAIVKVYPIY